MHSAIPREYVEAQDVEGVNMLRGTGVNLIRSRNRTEEPYSSNGYRISLSCGKWRTVRSKTQNHAEIVA
ncbi:unnamed protein product [Amaranthus hypochondriacus]